MMARGRRSKISAIAALIRANADASAIDLTRSLDQPVTDPATGNVVCNVTLTNPAANPGCVVLIGFEESAKVIQSMVSAGIGPQETPLYLVDGNLGNALGADLPPGVLEGTRG